MLLNGTKAVTFIWQLYVNGETLPKKNKLATCADFIGKAFLDGYFKLPFTSTKENTSQFKEYASQLLLAINIWAGDNANDNEIVSAAALISMLQLGWIDESYLNFLAKKTGKKVNTSQLKTQIDIQPKNKSVITENTTPSKSQQKVKVNTKPKLMNKKAGRDWVKHNLPLRSLFNLDDMVQLFGTYEKKTTGNVVLYYFKRIDMTFFVFSASRELVGFALCKFSR